MDTTSNALARILHLLALNPDVQNKLRAELVEAQAQYGERMPYNELSQLPYMDAVCRETMRMYVSPSRLTHLVTRSDPPIVLATPQSPLSFESEYRKLSSTTSRLNAATIWRAGHVWTPRFPSRNQSAVRTGP